MATPTLGEMVGVPSERDPGIQRFRVSASGQLSLPAPARRRWGLHEGGEVEVVDLGFGVLVVPPGGAAGLRREHLPAEEHLRFVQGVDDPDLRTS